MQVRWDDQSQYHQGFKSVFVGGRLSALLPPPAKKTKVKSAQSDWIPVTSRGRHTDTHTLALQITFDSKIYAHTH